MFGRHPNTYTNTKPPDETTGLLGHDAEAAKTGLPYPYNAVDLDTYLKIYMVAFVLGVSLSINFVLVIWLFAGIMVGDVPVFKMAAIALNTIAQVIIVRLTARRRW